MYDMYWWDVCCRVVFFCGVVCVVCVIIYRRSVSMLFEKSKIKLGLGLV